MSIDMFLKLGDMVAESRDDSHKDWVDLLAFSWGMSQSGSFHVGSGGGSGKVNVQDLSITKYVDKCSPRLIAWCCNGWHIPDATLVIRKAGGKAPVDYVTIKFNDLLVSSVSTGGSGGEDRLTENVTLNFAKFAISYQPQGQDGAKLGGAIDTNWDIVANKGS